MTTETATATTTAATTKASASGVMAALFCGMIGLGMVTLAGHVQSAALHDAAHDARHAAGFPCH